jgi:hypothetical protein
MAMPTSLAPGYIRMTYDGTLFPHHMTVPVKYSGTPVPGVEPVIEHKDAGTGNAIVVFNDLAVLLQPFFNTSVHFGLAEAHTVDPDTGEDAFIFAWNVGLLGTSTFATAATSQAVFSFKTALGTAYKLYLMEGVLVPNTRFMPPYTESIFEDLSDYVVGNSSICYGRGNSFPFVPVSLITKTNDKLRKQQGLA